MNYSIEFGFSLVFSVLVFSLILCFCDCNQTLVRLKRDDPNGDLTETEAEEDLTAVEIDCSRDFKKESFQLHKQVMCRPPRKKLVEVKMSSMLYMPGVVHLPRSYEVERCDGVCQQPNHKCLPIDTELIEIPLYSRLLSTQKSGDQRMNEKCMRVKMKRHLTCGCKCAMSERNCSDKQRFSRDKCACDCIDTSIAKTCAQNHRMWSKEKCDCICPPMSSRECSSGAMFDEQTCRCVETNR